MSLTWCPFLLAFIHGLGGSLVLSHLPRFQSPVLDLVFNLSMVS